MVVGKRYNFFDKVIRRRTIMKKTLVCFANSRKIGGKCFAGKELENNQWVRPVSIRHDESLIEKEECIRGRNCTCSYCNPILPNLLDVIEMDIGKFVGDCHQVENYLVGGYKWKKIGVLKSECIDDFLDTSKGALWINGYEAWHRKNDRIPSELSTGVRDSLRLIEVKNLYIIVTIEGADFGNPRKKVNGKFRYLNIEYIIPITDPIIEQQYLHLAEGTYSLDVDYDRIILSLSAGKEYNGYIYKFIAGVMLI